MNINSEGPTVIPKPDNYYPASSFLNPYRPQEIYETADEGITLLNYLRVVRRKIATIILFTAMVTLLSFIISAKMTKKYQAELIIAPVAPSSGGGLSSLVSQMSTLPLVGGQLGALSKGSQQITQFKGILTSRTLLEGVVKDLGLMPVLFKEQWDHSKNNWKSSNAEEIPKIEDGAARLKSMLKVVEDVETGTLKIRIVYKDPQLAAVIANQFIVRLQDFLTNNGLTVAKRNRQFVEAQLQKNKIDYLEFSKKMSEFYTANRISSIRSTVDVDLKRLGIVPKTFEEFRDKLKTLEEERIEKKENFSQRVKSDTVKDVPAQVYLEYLTLQRELLTRTNALLIQQYELAKIEEAKEDLAFQVIDKAITTRSPIFPNIRIIVIVSCMAGLFLSIFYVFFLEYINKLKAKEKSALK